MGGALLLLAALLLALVLDPLEPGGRALLDLPEPRGRGRLGLLHPAMLLLAAVLPPARAGARVAAVVPLVRPRRAERVAALHGPDPLNRKHQQ